MSRKPSHPAASGENSAWTPPAWLYADNTSNPHLIEGSGTNNRRNNNHHYYFSHPIQPVPVAVRKAIETKLTGLGQYSQEKKQINQLTAKLSDQRYKLAMIQDKVGQLEAEKERGLRDIRVIQEEKTQKALDKIEKDMRHQFQKERQQKEQAWKQALQDEYNEQKRQRQDEYKIQDEEAARKRVKSEANIADAVEASESIQALRMHAAEKRAQLATLKSKLESLNETKSEIVWLLKQVIKAEEKNKAKNDATKSPPKTTISKQA